MQPNRPTRVMVFQQSSGKRRAVPSRTAKTKYQGRAAKAEPPAPEQFREKCDTVFRQELRNALGKEES